MIKNVKGTPAKPDPASSGIEIPTRICLPKAGDEEDAKEWRKPRQEDKPRRTYLKKEDFEVHGYTEGCRGCRWIQTGIGQPGHDEKCRTRMEDHLRKEKHPRFQRAQDAKSSQMDQQTDSHNRMTDEELTEATEEYLKKNPDRNGGSDVTQTCKRKCEDDESDNHKAQKTSTVENDTTKEDNNVSKRGIRGRRW